MFVFIRTMNPFFKGWQHANFNNKREWAKIYILDTNYQMQFCKFIPQGGKIEDKSSGMKNQKLIMIVEHAAKLAGPASQLYIRPTKKCQAAS